MSGESEDGFSLVSPVSEEIAEDSAQAEGQSLPLICPILNETIFEDPVIAEDGIMYEREGIEAWFTSCEQRGLPCTSPCTRQNMGKGLTSDPKLRHKLGTPHDIPPALEDIASVHDLCAVFAALEPVRDILGESLEGWEPPQIVVIGENTCGKSTLLQRLAMLPIFPCDDKICTRLPIHVRLRNTARSRPTTLQVFNVRTNTSEEAPYVIPTSHGAVHVREKMEEIIVEKHGAKDGGVSSERIIIVTINSPYVPTIDLIDLPGLAQCPELEDSTTKMVQEHIKRYGDRCVFVATVNGMEAPHGNAAVELVRCNKLEDRTIGVLTMCDEIVPIERRMRMLLQRLETPPPRLCGGQVLEPHGWVCVMNKQVDMAHTPCCNFARLKQQAIAEEAFMRQYMAGAFDQGKAGCRGLVQRLKEQVVKMVVPTWGRKALKLVGEALDEARFANAALGLPALHVEESIEAAHEGAASEAKRRMEGGKMELVQGCCRDVLRQLKSRLIAITSEQLVKVDPSEFVTRWEAQRERFELACADAVSEWVAYLVRGVSRILKERTPPPQTRAAKQQLMDNPAFELGRFPAFIQAVEAHVNDKMVEAAKAKIVEGINKVEDDYYGIKSAWMTVATDVDGDVASVSVTCNHTAVVDRVIVCFIQQGIANILDQLCSHFGVISCVVPDSEWIESCAEEREELLLRISTLEKVRQDMLAHLLVDSDHELLLPIDECDKAHGVGVGVVEGNCGYITGTGRARGIAVDASGHIFVADFKGGVIKVFSGAGLNGTFVREFGAGHLNGPEGVAVDDEGSFYVSNFGGHTVSVFDKDEMFVRNIGTGIIGCEQGQLNRPYGVAVDLAKNVWVCNYHAHTVSVFDCNGRFIKNIGTGRAGTQQGQLSGPTGVAVDREGNVYIANYRANTVSIFNRDGDYVRHLGTGVAGSALGQLHSPMGVAVDVEGNVYVASCSGSHVSVFSKQGECVKQIRCTDPWYVIVDAKGQVLISECSQERVRVVRT